MLYVKQQKSRKFSRSRLFCFITARLWSSCSGTPHSSVSVCCACALDTHLSSSTARGICARTRSSSTPYVAALSILITHVGVLHSICICILVSIGIGVCICILVSIGVCICILVSVASGVLSNHSFAETWA